MQKQVGRGWHSVIFSSKISILFDKDTSEIAEMLGGIESLHRVAQQCRREIIHVTMMTSLFIWRHTYYDVKEVCYFIYMSLFHESFSPTKNTLFLADTDISCL